MIGKQFGQSVVAGCMCDGEIASCAEVDTHASRRGKVKLLLSSVVVQQWSVPHPQ